MRYGVALSNTENKCHFWLLRLSIVRGYYTSQYNQKQQPTPYTHIHKTKRTQEKTVSKNV